MVLPTNITAKNIPEVSHKRIPLRILSLGNTKDIEEYKKESSLPSKKKVMRSRVVNKQNVSSVKSKAEEALDINNVRIYKSLGKLVKKLRIDNKYSQEDLSNYLGLCRIAIINIEKGTRKLDVIEYFKLMLLLDPEFKDLSVSEAITKHLNVTN